MNGDTRLKLELWATWRRYGTGMPHRATRSPFGAMTPLANISDKEAESIDTAIAKLKKRDPEMADVVWHYYAKSLPIREVASELKISKDKADRLLLSGVAWIDGVLTAAA